MSRAVVRHEGSMGSLAEPSGFGTEESKFDGGHSVADGPRRGQAALAHAMANTGGLVPPGAPTNDDESLRVAIGKMMGDLKDPEFQGVLDDTVRELVQGTGIPTDPRGVHQAANSGTGEAAAALFGTLATNSGHEGAENLARTLEILQRLSLESKLAAEDKPDKDDPKGESAQAMEAVSEDVITRMMEEFERMGMKDDFDTVVENMMKQILAKEILYEPIRAINQRFPDWLGKNRDKVPRSEYENYGKMYQTFQQMQLVYETDGANFGKLASLMQQLQEFGMPPAQIIKDVAPGLELTPDGTPILPNAVPGMPSLPVGGAPGDGVPACSLM